MLTETNSSSGRGHALVVGSMAGLLAGRVLADHFGRVTDRQTGPLPGGTRVPQGRAAVAPRARAHDAREGDRREALPRPRRGPAGGGRAVDRLRGGLRVPHTRGLHPRFLDRDTVPAVQPRAPGVRRPRARGLGHALAATDNERAARMLEQNAESMLVHGEPTTLLRWLDALPEALPEALRSPARISRSPTARCTRRGARRDTGACSSSCASCVCIAHRHHEHDATRRG
jgi:hypothetical protein